MESAELTACLKTAVNAVERSMCEALRTPTEVEAKGGDATDVVTELDRAIERAIRDCIAREFPDHRVVGEEYGGAEWPAEYSWFIDPIDGTTNFAAGLPWFAISVAMMRDATPVVGVVGIPSLGMIVSAARRLGIGVTRSGPWVGPQTDRVPAVSGGVALLEWNVAEPWSGMYETIDLLRRAGATTRIMGSGTLAITQVALGAAAVAAIGNYDPIDHGAAACIALEAGCGLWSLGTHEPFDTSRPFPDPFYVARQPLPESCSQLRN